MSLELRDWAGFAGSGDSFAFQLLAQHLDLDIEVKHVMFRELLLLQFEHALDFTQHGTEVLLQLSAPYPPMRPGVPACYALSPLEIHIEKRAGPKPFVGTHDNVLQYRAPMASDPLEPLFKLTVTDLKRCLFDRENPTFGLAQSSPEACVLNRLARCAERRLRAWQAVAQVEAHHGKHTECEADCDALSDCAMSRQRGPSAQ